MSKMKLSFSLIFTLFLVGMLSTAAFAYGAYYEKVSADGSGGFTFNFTKPSTDAATDFTLKVYSIDPTTKALTLVATKTKSGVDNTQQTIAVAKTDATPNIAVGTVYEFELSHTTGGDIVGYKWGVLTESHNLKMANTADQGGSLPYAKADGTTGYIDTLGSGLANSNHTGADSQKKSGQKTHGFYQNNTNSCAVCHQTHTGADNNLLMKNGVYSTCSACHDGTTGAYNAFEPAGPDTVASIAGTFNVSYDTAHNGSIHDADGSLKVSAAPGGNSAPVDKTPFASNFDCASCHNPHGGGSLTENNLNQDPLGWGTVQYVSTANTTYTKVDGTSASSSKDNQYGKLFINPTIYTPATIPTSKGATYIFVLNTAGVADPTIVSQYKDANVTANTPILQTYRWGNNPVTHSEGYIPDYSLWLQEKGYPYKANTALYKAAWGSLTLNSSNNYYDASNDAIHDTDVHVVWKNGFAWGAGVANIQSLQVSLGVDVPTSPFIQTLYQEGFSKDYYDSYAKTTTTYTYVEDSGVEMSKYCASCHTDYASITRKDTTGVYTTAHRHQTLADETTCVRCHFGHGTDASIMKDANDQSYQSGAHAGVLDYYTDVNKSSALKRYTGMSVCYACHGQGEQFLGNPNNVDHPLSGQPGTDGRDTQAY